VVYQNAATAVLPDLAGRAAAGHVPDRGPPPLSPRPASARGPAQHLVWLGALFSVVALTAGSGWARARPATACCWR
jgi:hypothetical protein